MSFAARMSRLRSDSWLHWLGTRTDYPDDHNGFLRLEVMPEVIVGRYYEVPRPHEPFSKGNQLLDYWEFDWRNRKWIVNKLK